MRTSKFLKKSVLLFFFILTPFSLSVRAENSSVSDLLGDLKNITGNYTGEIRLQNSTGTLDTLLVPHAQFKLDFKKDRLILDIPKSFMGQYCLSTVGSIRELVKNSSSEPQILKAVFDYDSSHCPLQKQWDELLVYLNEQPDGSLVLETLLTHGPVDLVNHASLGQNISVHGFFTKDIAP